MKHKSHPTLRALKIRETQRENNPTKVELSLHYLTYRRWVVGGLSLRKCSDTAKVIYDENISRSSFLNYKKRLPIFLLANPAALPSFEQRLKVRTMESKVVLDGLIIEQMRRLALAREIENETMLPLEAADIILKSIECLCVNIFKMEKEAGLNSRTQ